MEKILQQGIHKKIPYQIKFIDNNFDFDEYLKIILIDIENNEEIGHITYTINSYSDSYNRDFDGIIVDIIDEISPMCIEYFYINPLYRLSGFGKLLFSYFVNNIILDNPCILLKASYGVNKELQKELDEFILPKFYESYGFKQIESNHNYYGINLNQNI